MVNSDFQGDIILKKQFGQLTAVQFGFGGNSYFKEILESLTLRRKTVSNIKQVFDLVENNSDHFTIIDRYYALTKTYEYGNVDKFKYIQIEDLDLKRYLYLTVNKNSDLLNKLNKMKQAYQSLSEDGYIRFINKSYTTQWLKSKGCADKDSIEHFNAFALD